MGIEGRDLAPMSSPRALRDIVSIRQQTGSLAEQGPRLTPVGGIIYGSEADSIVVLGSTPDRKLNSARAKLPKDFNAQDTIEGTSRIIALRGYDEVTVAQVDIGAVEVRFEPSIRGLPAMRANIKYVDPEIGEEEREFGVRKEELLGLFTGDRGRILIFEGTGLPEEIALMFEEKRGKNKTAHVFFIHPTKQEGMSGLDSLTGVSEFLQRMNDGLESSPFPLQNEALGLVRSKVDAGRIDLKGSFVRMLLLESQVMALAQMAYENPDADYQRRLEKLLPELRKGLVGKAIALIEKSRGDARLSRIVNQSLDDLLTEKKPEKKEITIFDRLKTPQALNLRQEAGNISRDSDLTRVYISTISQFIAKAENSDILDDAAWLVSELLQHNPFQQDPNWGPTIYYQRRDNGSIAWTSWSNHGAEDKPVYVAGSDELFSFLGREIDKKRSELLKKRHGLS